MDESRFKDIEEVIEELESDIQSEGYTVSFGEPVMVETEDDEELECIPIVAENLQERDTEETIYIPNDVSVYNGSYSGISNYEEVKGIVLEYLHWYDTGNLPFEE